MHHEWTSLTCTWLSIVRHIYAEHLDPAQQAPAEQRHYWQIQLSTSMQSVAAESQARYIASACATHWGLRHCFRYYRGCSFLDSSSVNLSGPPPVIKCLPGPSGLIQICPAPLGRNVSCVWSQTTLLQQALSIAAECSHGHKHNTLFISSQLLLPCLLHRLCSAESLQHTRCS